MAVQIVQVEGAAQLRATLRRAGDDLLDLKAAHGRVSAYVASQARSRAPRVTGTLAGTIRSSGTKTQALVRAGFKRVPYAGPIHWGWPKRNIRANPFISDAATSTESRWIRQYELAVDGIVRKIEGA